MRRLGRLASRIALAAAALAGAVLVLELSVRVVLSFDRNYLDEALVRPEKTVRGRELTLIDLIRSHPDDRVVYELRPGVRGTFFGTEVAINSLGARDVERALEKPPGTFRIVGLGDSHAFGWGVEREETYLAVLERLVKESFPGRRFEVWNLSVPGYNTVQEVRAFELRADAIAADLVVINYVDNDMDLPNFLALRPSLWTPRKLYVGDLARRRLAVMRDVLSSPADLVGVEPDPRTRSYRMDPERIPERYRPLFGCENMEAAFLRLLALARERRIPAVLLFNPDDYGAVLRGRSHDARPHLARALGERLSRSGYLVVDPQQTIVRHLRSHDLAATALWICPTDSHSSPLRHRLVAESLLEELGSAGVLGAGSTTADGPSLDAGSRNRARPRLAEQAVVEDVQ